MLNLKSFGFGAITVAVLLVASSTADASTVTVNWSWTSPNVTGSGTLTYDTLRWSRLSEQVFRIDKWSLCRG
jgi:hypothetical protein